MELKSKDLNRLGVLQRLIQEYCHKGRAEKMYVAKEEFKASGYEYSAVVLATLFDILFHFGNPDEVEASLRKLNGLAPDFILDEHKVLDFATLLVSKNVMPCCLIGVCLHFRGFCSDNPLKLNDL